VPRASHLIPAAAALILGAARAAAMTVGSARGAQAATTWPAHVFAPYVDTGLSSTTLTAVAADYGTQFFNLAFADGSGCQWSSVPGAPRRPPWPRRSNPR
jgi:hypothetical protein